ncbi:MAG: aminotransferase class V-fold PLP-dependent enzyme [bacterium]|nr:aminotransferase class V-fold PLP-dependent enzyme [bacterium]
MNSAAISTVSQLVQSRVAEYETDFCAGTKNLSLLLMGAMQQGRQAIADLLGVEVAKVGLTHTTGAALFHVAFGLRGGNVVVPEAEFPTNIYPWIRARDAGLIDEVRRVPLPDHRLTVDLLRPFVDSSTRVVAVSHVDFATGFRADLEELREAFPAPLLVVDAIQSLGAFVVNAAAVDVVAAGSHKWLRAGFGGAAMMASDRAMERLETTLTGWLGVADPLDFESRPPHVPSPTASRYQMSSEPVVGAVALRAACEVIAMAGVEAISGHISARMDQLEEGLDRSGCQLRRPWKNRSERAGILTFRVPGRSSAQLVESLRERGVILADRAGWLRASPHATSTEESVAMLLEAIALL